MKTILYIIQKEFLQVFRNKSMLPIIFVVPLVQLIILVNAATYEMYRSWKLSAGHWSAVNGHCRYYGYAMRLGSNGVWYACGIFAE